MANGELMNIVNVKTLEKIDFESTVGEHTSEDEEYIISLLASGKITLKDAMIISLVSGLIDEKYYSTEAIASILFVDLEEIKSALNKYLSAIFKDSNNPDYFKKEKAIERIIKFIK